MGRALLFVAAVFLAGSWVVAQPTPAGKSESPAKYTITPVGDRALLHDPATGDQWELIRQPSGRSVWLPVRPPLRGNEAADLAGVMKELLELEGPPDGPPGRYQYSSDAAGDRLFDTATGRLYVRKKKGQNEYDTWTLVVKGVR